MASGRLDQWQACSGVAWRDGDRAGETLYRHEAEGSHWYPLARRVCVAARRLVAGIRHRLHKPNPMPESVMDRPTRAHEYLFLLACSCAPLFWTHRNGMVSQTKPKKLYEKASRQGFHVKRWSSKRM